MRAVRLARVQIALFGLVVLGGCENSSSLPPYWGGDVETYKTTPHYRVFVLSGRGATSSAGYTWVSSRKSVDEAIEIALDRCQSMPIGYVCKVVYLGTIDVWGMNKEDFERAKAVYAKNPLATNDDL